MKYSTEIPTPLVNRYSIIFGLYGLGASVLNNGLTFRPLWTGMHRHLICTAIGSVIGWYAYRYEVNKNAQLEYRNRTYMERHPELFPPDEQRKVGNDYHNWLPLR
ncbi:NADH dehydrogenase [ubiquinone] 1 subunit C2-like [Anneissia japonica]|uniref:NADH dehydrogenase [ubiquinone] 1 subunit C2-like n=1 Tax=Anneissia japonica TaxID=1529436 RepID=UPI0014256C42|nr:NADH dehydrogenase [ubiquinone] 1 subunit C2-like [Anneissia japonica]